MNRNRFVLFMLVVSLYWAGPYSTVSYLSPFADKLGASLTFIGVITGSYGLMQFLFRLPLGIRSDLIGKRKIFIMFGTFCSFLSPTVMFLLPTPIGLLLGRCIAGLSACAYVPIAVTCTGFFPHERISQATAWLSAISAISQLLAMQIGSIVANLYNERIAFLIGMFLGLCAFILSFFLSETAQLPQEDKKPLDIRKLLSVIKDPLLLKCSLLAVVVQALTQGKVITFVPILAKRMALNSQLGNISSIATLFTFFASLLVGTFLLKYIKPRLLLVSGFILFFISCIMIPLLPANLLTLLLSQSISGFGGGLIMALLMGESTRNISNEKRATAMGFYQAIYALGMFFGPLLSGIIGDQRQSLDAIFYFLAALCLLGLAGSIFTLDISKKARNT